MNRNQECDECVRLQKACSNACALRGDDVLFAAVEAAIHYAQDGGSLHAHGPITKEDLLEAVEGFVEALALPSEMMKVPA